MTGIIKAWKETGIFYKMAGAILVGAVCGIFIPGSAVMEMLGKLFTESLKAMAPYLVFFLISSSIATSSSGTGKSFSKVIALYLVTTFLAALLAVSASMLFPVTLTLGETANNAVRDDSGNVLVNSVVAIVQNPVKALLEANYLSILFWAVAFGLCIKAYGHEHITGLFKSMSDVVLKILTFIIELAPFGIMGLVYISVSEYGPQIFVEYGKLVAVLVGAILVSALAVNPLIVGIILKRNPYPLVFTCIKESGLTAFFTRSSAANIPINMALCEKLGLEKDFYSISISLGSTVNMNGAAVTITTVTLALCNTLGIELGFVTTLGMCAAAVLGACGASGVAGGSPLLIPLACSFFGIGSDVAMQGVFICFVIGVIQDSFETAHNSSSDVILSATVQYRERMDRGEEVRFMGKFAKKGGK